MADHNEAAYTAADDTDKLAIYGTAAGIDSRDGFGSAAGRSRL
jgi:hypothetical protein